MEELLVNIQKERRYYLIPGNELISTIDVGITSVY